jgi:hypothetical protein
MPALSEVAVYGECPALMYLTMKHQATKLSGF